MRTLTVNSYKKTSSGRFWRKRAFYIPVSILSILVLVLGVLGYSRVVRVQEAAKVVQADVVVLKQSAKDQNIGQLTIQIPLLQKDMGRLRSDVQVISFVAHVPFASSYYNDSEHLFLGADKALSGAQILVKALLPYADVLGLKGPHSSAPKKTSEERIAELVLLAPALISPLDEATTYFTTARQEMEKNRGASLS